MLLPLSILHQYINFIMFPLSCFVLRFLLKKYRTVFQNQFNIWWEPRPRQTPYQNTKKLFSRNSLFLYFFVLLIIYQIFLKKSNKVAFVLALWPFLLEYSSACFAPRAFVLASVRPSTQTIRTQRPEQGNPEPADLFQQQKKKGPLAPLTCRNTLHYTILPAPSASRFCRVRRLPSSLA